MKFSQKTLIFSTCCGCIPLQPACILLALFYIVIALAYTVLESVSTASYGTSAHWVAVVLADCGMDLGGRFAIFAVYMAVFAAWNVYGLVAIARARAVAVKTYCMGQSVLLTVDGAGQFLLLVRGYLGSVGQPITVVGVGMNVFLAVNFMLGTYFLLVLWSYSGNLMQNHFSSPVDVPPAYSEKMSAYGNNNGKGPAGERPFQVGEKDESKLEPPPFAVIDLRE